MARTEIDDDWIRAQQQKYEDSYPREFAKERSRAGLFVLSFPKSGRTWHRVMLGVYLAKALGQPVETAFALDKLCAAAGIEPVVYSHNGANFVDWLPPDHELVATPDLFVDRPVLLLLRDPKDILVSAYFHARFRDDLFDGSISDFVREPRVGIEKILAALHRWHDNRHRASAFATCSYEEMTRHPEATLRQCLELGGMREISEDLLTETARFCAFENMQQQEETNYYRSRRMERYSDDPRARKVREGRVGGFRDVLSADDIAYVDAVIGRLGNPFR